MIDILNCKREDFEKMPIDELKVLIYTLTDLDSKDMYMKFYEAMDVLEERESCELSLKNGMPTLDEDFDNFYNDLAKYTCTAFSLPHIEEI